MEQNFDEEYDIGLLKKRRMNDYFEEKISKKRIYDNFRAAT